MKLLFTHCLAKDPFRFVKSKVGPPLEFILSSVTSLEFALFFVSLAVEPIAFVKTYWAGVEDRLILLSLLFLVATFSKAFAAFVASIKNFTVQSVHFAFSGATDLLLLKFLMNQRLPKHFASLNCVS